MRQHAYRITYLLFIIAFFKGLIEQLGVNETHIQLLIDILIVMLALISIVFMIERKNIILLGSKFTLLFLGFIFISYLLSDLNSLYLILFLRKFFIYIIFLYALLNIEFSMEDKENLFNLLLILFIIQVPAAFVKLILLQGTLEKIVGTMSVMEGSLATIMPLIPISYLISLYLNDNKIRYIVGILLFISIGLISNKLGILFYLFGLFIILTVFYAKKETNIYFINRTFFLYITKIFFYLSIIFLLFATINPRANPEHKVGGSIDIEFLMAFIDDYNHLKLKGSTVEADGRSDAPFVAFKKLKERGEKNIWFGFGAGDIVSSGFLPYKNPLLEKYNIGYGGRLGVVWIMMQLGVVGVIIFTLFHLNIFLKVYKRFSEETKREVFIKILALMGVIILFFIDFFTYSSELLYSAGVAISYYFFIYYILTYDRSHLCPTRS